MYPVFATLFFLTVLASLTVVASFFLGKLPRNIMVGYVVWMVIYLISIVLFTGPKNLNDYPKEANYKLPWKGGVSRFVAQGNRSFTSHRDFHEYAWDFVMPNGTEVLAARAGKVIEIQDGFKGIGLNSNVVIIEHIDGEKSAYAHIAQVLVKVGDDVKLGQPIALSGMVGQTIFPHVHFYVINKEGSSSKHVKFMDVPGGVPFAGRFYTSANSN